MASIARRRRRRREKERELERQSRGMRCLGSGEPGPPGLAMRARASAAVAALRYSPAGRRTSAAICCSGRCIRESASRNRRLGALVRAVQAAQPWSSGASVFRSRGRPSRCYFPAMNDASILPGRDVRLSMRSTSKEVAVAQRLDGDQPFDRSSSDLGDLELDGSAGLELNDNRAIANDGAGADVLNLEADHVGCSKLCCRWRG